jgi:hypothetical protein
VAPQRPRIAGGYGVRPPPAQATAQVAGEHAGAVLAPVTAPSGATGQLRACASRSGAEVTHDSRCTCASTTASPGSPGSSSIGAATRREARAASSWQLLRTLRAARALSAAQAANNRTMDHHTSVMRDPRERSAHRKAEAERKPLPPRPCQ